MGLPQVRFSLVLVVFVLTPDGRIETIDGGSLGPHEVARHLRHLPRKAADRGAAWPSGALEQLLRSEIGWRLPLRAVTSRFRPLMPRLGEHGDLVLPLWTTGRLEAQDAVYVEPGRLEFGALERLARALSDPGLVLEAQSEFRRAITGDPIVAELLSESRRARSLAGNELARLEIDGEIPPVFALLPERFTVNQLRDALAAMARIDGGEIEASSTFRRKVGELVRHHEIFTPAGEEPSGDARGRPPMAYRFDPHGWRRWLQSKADESPDRSARMSPLMDRVRSHRLRDAVSDAVSNPWGPGVPPPPPSPPSAAPGFSLEMRPLFRPSTPSARDAAEADERVARLESQLTRLSHDVSKDRGEMRRMLEELLLRWHREQASNRPPSGPDAR